MKPFPFDHHTLLLAAAILGCTSLLPAPTANASGEFFDADETNGAAHATTFTPSQSQNDILISSTRVPANWPSGTTVGTLTAANPGDNTHTFALVSGEGDDGNPFFIVEEDVVKTNQVFDHEIQNTYSIRVRATNLEGFSTETILILTLEPPHPVPAPGRVDFSFASATLDAAVRAIVRQPDGKWLVVGEFSSVNGESRTSIVRLNADGTRDFSFMDGLSGPYGTVNDIALQPDGKIVIVGSFASVNKTVQTRIARLHSNGTLDVNFAKGLFGANDTVDAVTLQSDGRILIGGYFTRLHGHSRGRIARLNTDGTLDSSFNASIGRTSATQVASIIVQPNGQILIGGHFSTPNGLPRHNVARLQSDGTLDSSFTANITGENAQVRSLVLQPDGKILIGGSFTSVNGTLRHNIARVQASGVTDSSFGQLTSGPDEQVWGIAPMADGRILIGGSSKSVNGISRNRLARLHKNGSLDGNFGQEQSGPNLSVLALTLSENEENIMIGGTFTSVDGIPRRRLALLYNGELPSSQAPSDILISREWITDDAPIGTIVGTLTALDPDLNDSHSFGLTPGTGDSGNSYFTIDGDQLKTALPFSSDVLGKHSIRILVTDANGLFFKKTFTITVTPTPIDTPGEVILKFEAGAINGAVRTIARQKDGKWIVGGDFTSIDGQPRGRIARLNTDCSLDRTFTEGMTGANGQIFRILLQEDGKLIVAGTFASINNLPRRSIARLHSNGTVDTTFEASISGYSDSLSLALQTDGKILIGGYNRAGSTRFLRLHPDGSLDSGFIPKLPRGFSSVFSLAVQTDGKILVTDRSRIARLHPNGDLDTSFSVAGIDGDINDTAVQEDGAIVIGGTFTTVWGQPQNRIARLSPDGSLDTNFGQNLAGVSGTSLPRVNSIIVEPNGQILIAGGFAAVNDQPRNRIARLNTDGSLDETYGRNRPGANDTVLAMASGGGETLIGGLFTKVNDIPRDKIALLRGGDAPLSDIRLSTNKMPENHEIGTTVATLSAAGSDPMNAYTFKLVEGEGDDGNLFFTIEENRLKTASLLDHEERDTYTIRIRTTNSEGFHLEKSFNLTVTPWPVGEPGEVDLSFVGMPDNHVRASARQSDGKYVITGFFKNVDGVARENVARLNIDGSLDESFYDPLVATLTVDAVVVQPDDKILIGGGFRLVHGVVRSKVARLNADGSLDTTFGQKARDINGSVWRIALQPDGKILIAGAFTSVHGTARGKIARLNSNGTLDTSFGNWLSGANDSISAVYLQDDGRILIGGRFTTVNDSPRSGLARLNPDGSLDLTFGDTLAVTDGLVSDILLQSDGKILVAGWFSTFYGEPRSGIVRLNSDGLLDESFATSIAGASHGIESLALEPDGRILIGGSFATVNGTPRSGLARLETNGSLDSSFIANTSGQWDLVETILLQENGNILIGGWFTSVNGKLRSRIARLHGNSDPAGPSGILLSRQSVLEKRPAGTLIGALLAVESATAVNHTFALVSGKGDGGNEFFAIEDDALRTSTIFEVNERTIFSIRIRAANSDGLWFKKTFIITVETDPYLFWAETLPENERSPSDDPGGHGISNLLRFAFGMNPLQPEREKLPQLGVDFSTNTSESTQTPDTLPESEMVLTLTYSRRLDDDTLIYTPEVSTDLTAWTSFNGIEETEQVDDEIETVTLTDSVSLEQRDPRFLRVRVER